MPQGIIQKGKQTLKLKNPDLFREANYIDGEWLSASDDGSKVEVFNKATGQLLGTVPNCGAAETQRAIQAATRAFGDFTVGSKSWAATTGKHRGELLTALFRELQANTDDLAALMVAENGKSLAEAKGEMAYSNGFVDWFAGEAQRTYGHAPLATLPGMVNVVIKQPIGVAGLITPWNFPQAMITRKMVRASIRDNVAAAD